MGSCEMPNEASRWIEPAFTNSRIKTAGKRIRLGTATGEDWEVFENHRRAHARTLNTHQIRLRRLGAGLNFSVAQRLKRRPTIIDKLTREPNMQLSTMHDIAGCRVILNSLDDLFQYRNEMIDKRSKHVHVNKSSDHFDYIKNPKATGYRGIPEIFKTRTGRTDAKAWDDLLIEVQLRTKAQHAWATAVETVDLLNGERAKFGEADAQISRFFMLASEIIARAHEGRNSCLPQLTNKKVVSEFESLDTQLGIVKRLNEAVQQNPTLKKNRATILIFHFKNEFELEVRDFADLSGALPVYEFLERELSDKADVVLVRAEKVEDLRRSFQNYFSDANDFVDLINEGRNKLS